MWFSAHDAGEPPHVHVSPGQQANPDESAKFWITADGFELANNKARIDKKSLNAIETFLNQNRDYVLARWVEFFQL
jgi:hypothetical protein